jgi:hypothetical protein
MKLIGISLVVINLVGICIYYLNENTQREDWRSAVAIIENNTVDNEIIIFEFPKPFAPFYWYSKGEVEAVGVTDSIYADIENTKKITKETIFGKSGIYYFEYLRELSDPHDVVRSVLLQEQYQVDKVFNFHGVGHVYHYAK